MTSEQQAGQAAEAACRQAIEASAAAEQASKHAAENSRTLAASVAAGLALRAAARWEAAAEALQAVRAPDDAVFAAHDAIDGWVACSLAWLRVADAEGEPDKTKAIVLGEDARILAAEAAEQVGQTGG